MKNDCDVLIVGAGVGGLTLALALHEAGIQCRVYEAAPEIKPLGVGINVLPHATRVLGRLGVNDRLAAKSVLTQEASFFNQYGQLIHSEAVGTAAGYDTPRPPEFPAAQTTTAPRLRAYATADSMASDRPPPPSERLLTFE